MAWGLGFGGGISLATIKKELEKYQKLDEKGETDGYVPLNSGKLIDAEFLPSYVDDVITVQTKADLPDEGETGKIYVVVSDEDNGDDSSTYRWSGTDYIIITNTLDEVDIKTMYESNDDTNAYTDEAQGKVDHISITEDIDLDTVGTYTESTEPPINPRVGDTWLDRDTGVIYKYVSDGTDSTWIETDGVSILGDNIARLDRTQEFTGVQYYRIVDLPTNNIDFSTSNIFKLNATEDEVTCTNVIKGSTAIIHIENAENITSWSSEFKFKSLDTLSGNETLVCTVKDVDYIVAGIVK